MRRTEQSPKELGLWLFSRTASRTLTLLLTPILLAPALSTSVFPETQVKESLQELEVKPQLLIRREREGAMFINNAYWIPCSFCFVFKSTHQLGSVYNLLSLGKNPRLREWSQLTPNSQLLREYPGFEPRSGPSSLSHHSGQQVLPV